MRYRWNIFLLLLLFCLFGGRGAAQSLYIQVPCDTTVCDSLVFPDTVYRFTSSNPNYWTTHHRNDTLASDTIRMWTIRVNTSTTIWDSTSTCYDYYWNGLEFSLNDGEHLRVVDTMLQSVNIAGCPHYKRLNLRLLGRDTTWFPAQACDQYYWAEADTTFHLSGVYQWCWNNQFGCDSVLLLDLDIVKSSITDMYDSICVGQTYRFFDRTLDQSGHYNQNYRRSVAPYCDSIIVLVLKVLNYPEVWIEDTVDCQRLLHCVTVHSNVDYVRWLTPDDDPQVEVQRNSFYAEFSPQDTTTYTLLVDYVEHETCPSFDTITLLHIPELDARFRMTPDRLTMFERAFEAEDISLNNTDRSWYVDGQYMGSMPTLTYEAEEGADSLTLMLEASNQFCVDTQAVTLTIFTTHTYTPNVFTPDAETNREFRIDWVGVTDFEMTIFDRGGSVVFHTRDMSRSWDGTYKGRRCPQGGYFYVIKYRDVVFPELVQTTKGSVLLLR